MKMKKIIPFLVLLFIPYLVSAGVISLMAILNAKDAPKVKII